MHVDYQFYKLFVFIDSNIILEAKPLSELPWEEIDKDGPILVLVSPTVLREIDSKKRDGRLAVRARDFNRRMAQILDDGESISLRASQPRVDMNFSSNGKIDWEKYAHLDPNEGDCKVVAEILNAKHIDLSLAIVLSQDIAPLLYASYYNLRRMRASESWLQAPEQSPLEKENAKLRRQVADFSKTEPEIDVDLEFPSNPEIYRVEKLEVEQQMNLIVRIQELNPRVEQSNSAWGVGSSIGYDYSYNEKYDKFIDGIPAFVDSLSDKLELLFCQVPMKILLSNSGGVRAENLHIEFKVIGGWLNDRPIFFGGFPTAPKPDPFKAPVLSHLFNRHDSVKPEAGRHEVEIGSLKRSESFELQCSDLRHGQKWAHDAILWIDPNFAGEAKIVITITAANKRGSTTKIIKIANKVVSVLPFDLIDETKGRVKADFHVKKLIEASIRGKKFDEVEFPK